MAQEESARLALEAEAAKVAFIESEKQRLATAKANLSITFDRMENKRQATSGSHRIARGSIFFACVNKSYYWMIASQAVDDWQWLENNRTIILFPDDVRFIQDHTSLNKTDVDTDAWNQVKCHEELHVDISEAVPKIVECYEERIASGSELYLPLRIGTSDMNLTSAMVRDIVALAHASND